MDFVKYYQDELVFLRELGVEFSRYYPKLAPYLAKSGTDPDVERLLEAFAFLSARTRQKIDDEIPEITESIFETLWPQLLRPIPSFSILKFSPIAGAISEKRAIPKNTEVESVPVDGVRCRFRTALDVDVLPIEISAIETNNHGSHNDLKITIRALNEMDLVNSTCGDLRFYINTDFFKAENLIFLLKNRIRTIDILDKNGNIVSMESGLTVQLNGIDSSVLPYPENVEERYSPIIEYFSFRQKYHFFQIAGLGGNLATLIHQGIFTISIRFESQVDVPVINSGDIELFCTPIVNLFHREAEPTRLRHDKAEYLVRASVENNDHYDLFEIVFASGRRQGDKKNREYVKYLFHEFYAEKDNTNPYYTLKRKPAFLGSGTDTYISVFNNDRDGETLSLDILATNKNLPHSLQKGDICFPTASTPEFVTFENITVPTPSYPSPLRKNIHWLLVKSISFGKQTNFSANVLKEILTLSDYPAFYSHQEERNLELKKSSIETLKVEKINVFVNGSMIKGQAVRIEVDETSYSGPGEIYVFFTAIYQALRNMVGLNEAIVLTVRGKFRGGLYEWKN